MKLKRTTKESLKKVLVAVLVVGAVAGAAVGIKELNEYRDEDTKVIQYIKAESVK